MRRFRRTLAWVCAVLLLAAVLGMWVRGYWARDGIWYSTDSTRYGLHSYRGRAWFWRLDVAPGPTAMVWTTPVKMDRGFVHDSAPDSWYAQFASLGPFSLRPDQLLEAPFGGGGGGAAVDRGALGFRYVRDDAWYPRAQLMDGYPTVTSIAVAVPHWALALAAATWPAGMVWRAARRRVRAARGLCVTCGYDLRASGDVCPECGAAATGSA
jgi:hypothetical protein